MENEYENSSDEDTTAPGHPMESCEIVLKNLAKGIKYHKNGPAQQYDWKEHHIKRMTEIIKDSVKNIKPGRRKIRAMNYLGEEFPGGLLGWVNAVRSGRYFSDNPEIVRGPHINSGERSNFWLWNYVSDVLLAELNYWTKVHKMNKDLDPSKAKYPDITKMIFRHTDDFVGGLWTDFSKHWEPFVHEMR